MNGIEKPHDGQPKRITRNAADVVKAALEAAEAGQGTGTGEGFIPPAGQPPPMTDPAGAAPIELARPDAPPGAPLQAPPPSTAAPVQPPPQQAAPPAVAAPAAPSGSPQPTVGGGDAAVSVDAWTGAVELTYEDADTGEKFVVRAPKEYADKVKNGYLRRSVMDRNSRYLKQAQPVLEPLITSGQFSSIQPLIERATTDREFAEFVSQAYARRALGQRLAFADAVEEARRAGAADRTAAAPAPQDAPADNSDIDRAYEEIRTTDPYVGELIRPVIDQLRAARTEAHSAKQAAAQYAAEQQRQQQTAAQQQAAQQATNRLIQDTLVEMRAYVPHDFNGDAERERALMNTMLNYATSADLFRRYGQTPAVFRIAYDELARLSAQRTAAVASPGADAVEAAARERAAALAQQAVGAGRAAAPPPPAAPPKITTRRPDGRPKTAREIAAEIVKTTGG